MLNPDRPFPRLQFEIRIPLISSPASRTTVGSPFLDAVPSNPYRNPSINPRRSVSITKENPNPISLCRLTSPHLKPSPSDRERSMARKRIPAAARNHDGADPQAKPDSPKRSRSPPATAAAAAADTIGHLKTLNNLLLKETMERREQMSHLNSLVGELTDDSSIRSAVERDVTRLVLSSNLADECLRFQRPLAVAEERVGIVEAEKDDIKKELDRAVSDLHLRTKEVEVLEAKVWKMERKSQDLEREMEEVVRSSKEEVEALMAGRAADAAKISALEVDSRSLVLAKDRLEAKLSESICAFDLLKKKEQVLRSEIARLEQKNVEVLAELENTSVDLGVVKKEKEEGEKRFGSQTKESMQQLDHLSAKMGELAAQKDEIERARAMQENEMSELQKEVQQLQSNVAELEGVCKDYDEANALLKTDRDSARSDLDRERGDIQVLRLQLAEFDQTKGELENLRMEFALLKRAKEEGEEIFKSQMSVSTQQLDDLRGGMQEILRQKDEIEQAKAKNLIEIVGLQEEVVSLQSNVVKLEGHCKEHADAKALLQADVDAACVNLDLEKGKAEVLSLRVAELEKNKDSVEEELKRVQLDFALLKREKEEGDERFESQIRESTQMLDNLRNRMEEIVGQKDELEQEKAKKELDITGLQKEVEQLHSTVLELKQVCADHTAVNSQLRADRDDAKRDLDAEREEAGRLEVKVAELEKTKDCIMEELGQLKAEQDSLFAENQETKGRLGLLMEEKALLERNLTDTQHELEFTKRKMKSSEVNSERALSLLRRASEVMLGADNTRENSVVREIGNEGEEMEPFVAELETIKSAFMSREGKMKDLSQEIGLLQRAVEETQKKNGGILTWLLPATTALAACLATYAAKVR